MSCFTVTEAIQIKTSLGSLSTGLVIYELTGASAPVWREVIGKEALVRICWDHWTRQRPAHLGTLVSQEIPRVSTFSLGSQVRPMNAEGLKHLLLFLFQEANRMAAESQVLAGDLTYKETRCVPVTVSSGTF